MNQAWRIMMKNIVKSKNKVSLEQNNVNKQTNKNTTM